MVPARRALATAPQDKISAVLVRPKGHFDHAAWEVGLLVALGVALAVGTTVGVAWAAGFGDVLHRLAHPT